MTSHDRLLAIRRLVLAVSVVWSSHANAILVDYSAHSPTAITVPQAGLPAAGGFYIDPVFNTKIIRVTDTGTCMTPYASWPAFNADSSLLLVECGQGENRLYRFTKATDNVASYAGGSDNTIQDGTPGPVNIEVEGAYWSQSDPNIIYVLGSYGSQAPITRLYRVSVAPGVNGASRFGNNQNSCCATTSSSSCTPSTLGCIRDFGSSFSAIAELGKSENDDVFTFRTDPKDQASTQAARYVLSTNTLATWTNPFGDGNYIHESKVNKNATATSGYTYINYTTLPSSPTSQDSWVWNMDGSLPTQVTQDTGHYDLGRSFIVGANDSGLDLFTPLNLTPQSILTFQNSAGDQLCNDSCLSTSDCPNGATCDTNAHYCLSSITCNGDADCGNNNTGKCDTTQHLCRMSRPCYAMDVSLRSHDEKIALVSTYTGLSCIPGSTCTTPPFPPSTTRDYYSYPFNNELILTYTDNPSTASQQAFVRLGHIRSDFTDSDTHYAHQPHAVIDRLARYIVFSSDQGLSGSTDVYILKIPHAAHPTIGSSGDSTFYNGQSFAFHLDYAGRLWIGSYSGNPPSSTSWSLAASPGTPLTGGLARISSTAIQHDSVWAIGQNGHLYAYYNYMGAAPNWVLYDAQIGLAGTPPPCTPTGNPAAYINTGTGAAAYVGVVFTCTNGNIGQLYFANHSWNWWMAPTPPTPMATDRDPAYTQIQGSDHILAVSPDGNLWRVYPGNWTNLGNPGTALVASPGAAISISPGTAKVVAAGANGKALIFNEGTTSGSWGTSVTTPCTVDGDFAAGYASYWSGMARCTSGDKASLLVDNGVVATYTVSVSDTGYPGLMPISQPAAPVSAGGWGGDYLFQTTAGTQRSATANNGGTTAQYGVTAP